MAKLKDKDANAVAFGAETAATNCRPSSGRKSPVGLQRRDGRVNGHTTRKRVRQEGRKVGSNSAGGTKTCTDRAQEPLGKDR